MTNPKKSPSTAPTVEGPGAEPQSRGNHEMKSTTPSSQAQQSANDPKYLQQILKSIDGMAGDSLAEIAAIANMALVYMETPEGYRHPDNVAHALRAICCGAEVLRDSIGIEAERVGCGQNDERQQRRREARRSYGEDVAAQIERRKQVDQASAHSTASHLQEA